MHKLLKLQVFLITEKFKKGPRIKEKLRVEFALGNNEATERSELKSSCYQLRLDTNEC